MISLMTSENKITVIVFSNKDEDKNVLLKRADDRKKNKNGHIWWKAP